MQTSPFRIALVGYGIAGSLHALAYRLLPLMFSSLARPVELALVVEPSEIAGERAKKELGIPVVSELNSAIISRYGIEALDCCTQTEYHADICRLAIHEGLDVLCEKPLTGTPKSSRELIALAQHAKICFGVNFNFRFVPALQEARRRLMQGQLGELKSFHIEYHRSSNIQRWKNNLWTDQSKQRGALLDLGPHAIDMVHFLFGPIRELSAQKLHYSAQVDVQFPEDIAKLQVVLQNNALGSIEVSKITPGAANDLNIFVYGTEGTLRFSMNDPNVLDIFASGEDWRKHERYRINCSGVVPSAKIIPPETPTGVLMWHTASIASFIDSAIHKSMPLSSIRDGLGVDLALEAALISLSDRSMIQAVGTW